MTEGPNESGASRTATIRTAHEHPGTVAGAVGPDNTAEMEIRVESGTVITTIERETTGGLQSTVDDYVANVEVAETVAGSAARFEPQTIATEQRTNTAQTTDTNGYRDTETQ